MWLNQVPMGGSCEHDSNENYVRFQVLTDASIKMTAFRDIVPCSLVEVYRRFTGTYCLSSGRSP
jgi:hypothetical protein